MESNIYIPQIEAYLNGELSPQARTDLEQKMAAKPEVQTEFDRRQFAHNAIEVLIEDDLRASLRSLETEGKKTNITSGKVRTMKSSRRLLILSVAASVALLVGFFALNFRSNTSPEQLAANYYERPSFELRGKTEIPLQNLEDGLAAMKTDDYKAALAAFEAIPNTDEHYAAAQYYRAHALYLEGNMEAAMQGFQATKLVEDARYTENATWYQVLACLAASKGEICIVLLDTILEDDGHSYYKKAKDLKLSLK